MFSLLYEYDVTSIQYCGESHAILSSGKVLNRYSCGTRKVLKTIRTPRGARQSILVEDTNQLILCLDHDVEYRNGKLHQCLRVFNVFSGIGQQAVELVGVVPDARPIRVDLPSYQLVCLARAAAS